MKTAEIAGHLASAAARFPFLGPCTAADLEALVAAELGHPAALDDFQPHGAHFARAIGPQTILHIISGNTPAAGLQSLIRGLLLGAHNLCKTPSAGLPELAEFCAALTASLAARVECTSVLPEDWLARADALIVFGTDETIAHFRAQARPEQRFIAHGHQLSFGVVLEDPRFESVGSAARDVAAFDQLGCLSPQVLFIRESGELTADDYAGHLAAEMERRQALEPRRELGAAEAAEIRRVRAEIAFRAANGGEARLWESVGSTAWTVVCDQAPGFPRSPLHRFIFVKPLPADLVSLFTPLRKHLSTAGLWPVERALAAQLVELGVKRICPLGRMQEPPLTWHQDGRTVLAELVHWVDLEQ